MQTLRFQNDSSPNKRALISKYQDAPKHSGRLSVIRKAVRTWEQAVPGKAQEVISQKVAKEWFARGGKGLLLAGSTHNTKQNFFRMIREPGPKNDKSLHQLVPVILDLLPVDIARQHGLVVGKTKEQLLACAIKEDGEVYQAVLADAPPEVLIKELSEKLEAGARLAPKSAWAGLVAGLGAALGVQIFIQGMDL